MSFGIGLGDILFFVDQTLKLYGKCKDAPVELRAAGRDVEQMRAAVQILADAISDSTSLVKKEPSIVLMIEHEMGPLEEDMMELNAILTDYIDRCKIGLLGRLRYAIMDEGKLHSIRSSIKKTRTNFALMLNLINMKAHEQHARDARVSVNKLDEILDKQSEEAATRKDEVKARSKADAKLEEILDLLQRRYPDTAKVGPIEYQPGDDQTSQVLNQLEQELLNAGLSKEKAGAARKSASEALSTTSPQPKKRARNHKPSIPPSHVARDTTSLPTDPPDSTPAKQCKPQTARVVSPSKTLSKEENPALATSGSTTSASPDSSTPSQHPSRPLRPSPPKAKSEVGHSAEISPPEAPRPKPVVSSVSNPDLSTPRQHPSRPLRPSPPKAKSEVGHSAEISPQEAPRPKPGVSSPADVPMGGKLSPQSPDPKTSLPKETRNYGILCVDNACGTLARLANAYLELLRVKTANSTGRWLFNRVLSAGMQVDQWNNAPELAVNLLIPRSGFKWAQGWPNETGSIVALMKKYNYARPLTADDLRCYQYILCFNAADRANVDRMIAKYGVEHPNRRLARVVTVTGCEESWAMNRMKQSDKLERLKEGIKDFVSTELGDWSYMMERTKNHRICHHSLRNHELNRMDFAQCLKWPQLQAIKAETGCTIFLAKLPGNIVGNLMSVSIMGPKEKLKEAWTLLNHE